MTFHAATGTDVLLTKPEIPPARQHERGVVTFARGDSRPNRISYSRTPRALQFAGHQSREYRLNELRAAMEGQRQQGRECVARWYPTAYRIAPVNF
jgi:hypothetical protein